jgi:hypothetical protein
MKPAAYRCDEPAGVDAILEHGPEVYFAERMKEYICLFFSFAVIERGLDDLTVEVGLSGIGLQQDPGVDAVVAPGIGFVRVVVTAHPFESKRQQVLEVHFCIGGQVFQHPRNAKMELVDLYRCAHGVFVAE